jgi:hypothetical protein
MYQTQDSIESVSIDGFDDHDHEVPGSLEHWSLDDFGDILPVRRITS